MTALKNRTVAADPRRMRPVPPPAHDQQGFTLVELMVAVLVLVVGLLGVMTMVDIANRSTGQTNARIAATNLAREVIENARSIDYEELTDAQIAARLQAKPGLAGSGNPWQLERRRVTYSVAVEVCTFDDPKDGLAPAADGPVDPCPPAAAVTGAPQEINPDDFRRITVTLTWRRDAKDHTMSQSELIVNPSGSLGPRIVDFPEPAGQVTSGTQVDFTVTTTRAGAVRWNANDGRSSGDAAGGPTSWTFSWAIGADPASPDWVADGAYTVSAQAVNVLNIPGDARFATVLLNRNIPLAVPVSGGRNQRHGGIVDVRWERSVERDVRGYRLYRVDPVTGAREKICELGMDAFPECTDKEPPIGVLQYQVVALDVDDLGSATNSIREGTPSTLLVGALPLDRPEAPQPTTVLLEEGLPRFDWIQPAGITAPTFYRVYRMEGDAAGPPQLEDRYAVTSNADPFWRDPDPLGGKATYWFTAIGSSFNESVDSVRVVYP